MMLCFMKANKKQVKLFFIFFLLFITSCSTEYCIYQTLKDGALACKGETCSETYGTICNGHYCYPYHNKPVLVRIDKIDGIKYYDDLIFELPDNLKDVWYGELYEYTTANNVKKTIKHIRFVNKK